MKIKVSRRELNECLSNVMKRIIEESNENVTDMNTNPIYPNENNNDKGEWDETDNFVNYITIKTDIDPIEEELIDTIQNNFSENEVEIDSDINSGYIAFNVTKNKELINRFIDFLNDNDVNIID